MRAGKVDERAIGRLVLRFRRTSLIELNEKGRNADPLNQ